MTRLARVPGKAALLVIALAVRSAATNAETKPYVESSPQDLIHNLPELAGIQPADSQASLNDLLRATGQSLAGMFRKFVDVSCAEDVHEMRFQSATLDGIDLREKYRYLVRALPAGSFVPLREIRMAVDTDAPAQPNPKSIFLAAPHFLEPLNYLLPQYQAQNRYLYVGRSSSGGDSFVVAFEERAGVKQPRSPTGLEGNGPVLFQGLVWIDAATFRVSRVRESFLPPMPEGPLQDIVVDSSFTPVTFSSVGVLPLPSIATVEARFTIAGTPSQNGAFHTVYRYSDYRLYGRDAPAGIAANQAPTAEDPIEQLAHVVKEDVGDLVSAESEFRAAVAFLPDSNLLRNRLGIILFKRGDIEGAIAEFRTAAELDPKDPLAHANLGDVLASRLDRAGASEQYRIASSLAPGNAAFKSRYEALSKAAAVQSEGQPNIKVDVRQVLVPVVVTDKQGHHVMGLKQSDFSILEDGKEQAIAAFSVENTGLVSPSAANPSEPAGTPSPDVAPAKPQPANAPRVARHYLICIDTLHLLPPDFFYMRKALKKLFAQETSGDADYALIGLGAHLTVVQDTTTDPAKVLASIDSKAFESLLMQGRTTSSEAELADFRRLLNEVSSVCSSGGKECDIRKRELPPRAAQLKEMDRSYTTAFLKEFRDVIENLSKAPGRRSVVLISDGFELIPGKDAVTLLTAYFPEARDLALSVNEPLTNLFDPIVRLASANNIPLYTIDARGLEADPTYGGSRSGPPRPMVQRAEAEIALDASGTLETFSSATGGAAYRNDNDLLNGMERAFADGRQYYVLAYVSSNRAEDGKFRSITVTVRNKNLKASYKRGYWADAKAN